MASYKSAVEAKCKSCIYDQSQEGAWRQQVEACTSTDCPLFEVRPLSINTQYEQKKVKAKK